jgi:lipoprotein-anchoring transpeptidase ErfK/SrfK
MEEGVNKGTGIDSYSRYIYIHGTPEEWLLGKKASKGCIRMSNSDVIELFSQLEGNETVYIDK